MLLHNWKDLLRVFKHDPSIAVRALVHVLVNGIRNSRIAKVIYALIDLCFLVFWVPIILLYILMASIADSDIHGSNRLPIRASIMVLVDEWKFSYRLWREKHGKF